MPSGPDHAGEARKWRFVAVALVVILVGGSAAGFAMRTTDQAAFCGSCHVMNEAALTHKRSVHAKQACNECHTPHDLAAKLPYKTASGASDIFKNTFSMYQDVIHAGQDTRAVVQENCVRCHAASMQNVAKDAKARCVDCHRSVPHQTRTPISTRKAADA